MKRKDILMLSATMMGIASGWAVLNDQIYAMTEDELLPLDAEAEEGADALVNDSVVLENESDKSDIDIEEAAFDSDSQASADDQTVTDRDTTIDETKEEAKNPSVSSTVEETDKDLSNVSKNESIEDSPLTDIATTPDVDNTLPTDSVDSTVALMKTPAKTASGPVNGWVSNKYYVNGTLATGETKIGQDRYLFDNDGNPLKGFLYYDGKLLYCGSNGKIQTGSFTVEKQTFTTDGSGAINSMNSLNIPYYNQLDPRWSGTVIGTGTMGSTPAP